MIRDRRSAPGHPRFRLLPLAALLAAGTGLAACAQGPAMPVGGRAASEADILVSVPDPGARERWQAALASANAPPVDALSVPETPLAARPRPVAESRPAEPAAPPTLAPAPTVDVAIAAPGFPGGYAGAATVTGVTGDSLTLRPAEGEGEIRILYRRPGGEPLPGVAEGDRVRLRLAERVGMRPQQARELALARAEGRVLLLYLQASGEEPITRSFREGAVTVAQETAPADALRAAEAEGTAVRLPVRLTVAGRATALEPGSMLDARQWEGPVDAVLFHSQANPPSSVNADSAPYELTIALFAVR
ncbi:MAG: hypothetical protein RID91_03955 [Azospirillaceae bacterium]